jgi:hypothetical protein
MVPRAVAHKKAACLWKGNELRPDFSEGSANFSFHCRYPREVARLLLPQRKAIENEHHQGSALHRLNQIFWREVRQQDAVDQTAKHGTHQQHGVHQRHHAGPGFLTGLICGQRQTSCLRSLQACTDHQEGHGGCAPCPTQSGTGTWPRPDSTKSAKGMTAKPKN